MADSSRVGPTLSGLVSPAAAALYAQLLASGGAGVRIGQGQGEVSAAAPALAELLAAKIAFRTGDDDELLRVVTPASALRALLELHHTQLDELQRRIMGGWRRLAEQLPWVVQAGSAVTAVDGVEVITDVAQVATLVAELFHSPKRELRGTETGEFPTRPSPHRVFLPRPDAIRSGVRYRYIYQAAYYGTAPGRQIVDESVAAGEQVRLRRTMPVKMVLSDLTAAVVSVDRAGQVALLVRSPDLLAMLADWFDAIWADQLTTTIGGDLPAGLKPDQLRVLRQLPVAGSDEAIAKNLQLSISTVRRHVRAIYAALGVNTRFAAGAAAARRNWI